MFILPESVPAYFAPTSMQVLQLPGIVRSLQKLANPMARTASNGSLMYEDVTSRTDAPLKPSRAVVCRVRARLPVARTSRGVARPQRMAPKPPQNKGIPASAARDVLRVVSGLR